MVEIIKFFVYKCMYGIRPDDHCWWCDPDNISGTPQTRDHLFKHCSRWKDQQAQLWARVKETTKRGK